MIFEQSIKGTEAFVFKDDRIKEYDCRSGRWSRL